jgi:hypothetical protein
MLKLVPGRITPDSASVVWITLRAPGEVADAKGQLNFRARMPSPTRTQQLAPTVPEERPARVQLRRADDSATVVAPGTGGTTSRAGLPGQLRRTRPDGGGREPLYIVGGRELSGDAAQRVLDSMNASDFAIMEVLDSGTAVARYGARAAHGAIIFKSNRTARRDTIHY